MHVAGSWNFGGWWAVAGYHPKTIYDLLILIIEVIILCVGFVLTFPPVLISTPGGGVELWLWL